MISSSETKSCIEGYPRPGREPRREKELNVSEKKTLSVFRVASQRKSKKHSLASCVTNI